mmetsp:Transcript_6806/g.11451  ORF Transcript_6806/g.11451 Transcript_6806/m.11451 type:complete len:103 (+) Transcript_6806:705-1013(+)
MTADLNAVPAHNLPMEQQVDSHFPYASKALLGYHLPLFKSNTSDEDNHDNDMMQDIGIERRVMGSITLDCSVKSPQKWILSFVPWKTETHHRIYCFVRECWI